MQIYDDTCSCDHFFFNQLVKKSVRDKEASKGIKAYNVVFASLDKRCKHLSLKSNHTQTLTSRNSINQRPPTTYRHLTN